MALLQLKTAVAAESRTSENGVAGEGGKTYGSFAGDGLTDRPSTSVVTESQTGDGSPSGMRRQ